ncbi:uncharacterized protein Z520_12052 [Fonsecaea multimorphosa CBS 102226]|uniref:PNPLA domain-containing protein n=1 Tax=Fonsecaea multimorphosa CBS 102226 TaxID=1442371 RepID=A0A0D2I4Y6_9EURO|nr:uncharacterized protein Z520_12052 [Fonsecaea multimorphosa CBS 102226]KIX92306.1 hypothetical protein Z520_12052 [Fonsecaea multimorphosa CBS 102226]OAL17676.1 hypothetical protein AYO22_11466 [Fonsecaea multimorphosa]
MSQQQPLKILTLDGGGLQALATLSSLNAVCRAIANQNGADRPPAPHELFDIIAGVGTGGWIALLLGRYCLDITTCTAFYMEIATKTDINMSQSSSRRNRPFKLDQDRLMTVVEETLQRYGLDPSLMARKGGTSGLGRRPKGSRCKYAFAAGVVPRGEKQAPTYALFRSYDVEGNPKDRLMGSPNPESCQVPEVFCATGAAKFFLKPYKIGDTVFFDEIFPQSHPISSLALDEALRIYGTDVEISVLLNIGPGIPVDKDCEELDLMSLGPISRLTRKFSWPLGRRLSLKQKLPFAEKSLEAAQEDLKLTTSPSETALRLESQRREDIRARLGRMYGTPGADKYHHLGPAYSVERASLNDVHAIRRPQSGSGGLKEQRKIEAENVVRQVWVGAAA